MKAAFQSIIVVVMLLLAVACVILAFIATITVDHNNRIEAGAYSYLLDGTSSISQVNTTDLSMSWKRDVMRTHLEREAVEFYFKRWHLSRSIPQALQLPLPKSLLASGTITVVSLVLLHALTVIIMLRRHYDGRNDYKPCFSMVRLTWQQLYGGLPMLYVASSLAGIVSGTYILLMGLAQPGINSFRIDPELNATLIGLIVAALIGLSAWIDRARKAINGLSHDGVVHCECGFRLVGERREYHLLRCPECGTPVTQTTGQVRIPRHIRLIVRCANVAAIAVAMLCIAIHASGVQTTSAWRRTVETLAGGSQIAYMKLLTDDIVALSYRVDNETQSVVLYCDLETRPRRSSVPGSSGSFIYGWHGQIRCRYLKLNGSIESIDRTKLESMLKSDGKDLTWLVDVGEHGQFSNAINHNDRVQISVNYTINEPEFVKIIVNTNLIDFDRWRSGTRYGRDN